MDNITSTTNVKLGQDGKLTRKGCDAFARGECTSGDECLKGAHHYNLDPSRFGTGSDSNFEMPKKTGCPRCLQRGLDVSARLCIHTAPSSSIVLTHQFLG